MKIFIPDGDSEFAFRAVRCLGNEKDTEVYAMGGTKFYRMKLSRYCKRYYLNRHPVFSNLWLEAADAILRRINPDVIFPTLESFILYFNSNAHDTFLNYPYLKSINPDIFSKVINKWGLYQVLDELKEYLPTTLSLDDFHQKNLRDFNYPALLKAKTNTGGQDIIYIESHEMLEKLMAKKSFVQTHILQTYLNGEAFGLDAICRNGKILAYNIKTKKVLNKKNIYSPAAIYEFTDNQEVYTTAEKVIGFLKWEGPINMDFVMDRNQNVAKLLEINGRLPQTMLGNLAMGINLPYLACLNALDIDFIRPDPQHGLFSFGKNYLSLAFNKEYRHTKSNLKYIYKDPIAEIYHIAKVMSNSFT